MTTFKQQREADFLAAVSGIHTRHVAAALNTFTPGVSYTRCNKMQMANSFAMAFDDKFNGGWGGTHLRRMKLEDLAARARARANGMGEWNLMTAETMPKPPTAIDMLKWAHKTLTDLNESIGGIDGHNYKGIKNQLREIERLIKESEQ